MPSLESIQEELLARRLRKSKTAQNQDIVGWAEAHYYISETGAPIVLLPHQKAVLALAFTPSSEGLYPYHNIVYSSVKKSGKSAVAGLVSRYIAETSRYGEIYCCGNDATQAQERAFKFCKESIQLTPGFKKIRGEEGELEGLWRVRSTKLTCLSSGSRIMAVAADARGEAGANPSLTVWTELWGYEYEFQKRFWEEMVPVPTRLNSLRLVETYAGFEGQSDLLRSIYDLGMEGRQLTAGELSDRTGYPLGVFAESPSFQDLVPIWVNERASLVMYWDTGAQARRMPWQRAEYYDQEAQTLKPTAFARFHLNEWAGGESALMPIEAWDACYDPDLPPLLPGSKEPIVIGVDAASTSDCFGIVAVSRHPNNSKVPAIRAVRRWDPPKGGRISYSEPEMFLRTVCQGGCPQGHPKSSPQSECEACRGRNFLPPFNVVQVAYDPYQMEDMSQRLRREGVVWCEEFSQGKDRLIADKELYDRVMRRELAHDGNRYLREHIQNANAKLQRDEDSKLRIVKRAQDKKIDLVVATSMAVHRCMYLRLE